MYVARTRRVPRPAIVIAVGAVFVSLMLPLVFAHPSNLTSDESLYLAESYSLAHGGGAAYPSGEPVAHRAPLYPLALAPSVAIGGPDGAYVITKAIVILNALLVAAIAWRMGGATAGTVAGIAAGASAYLNGLGTTLYLDPLESMFALLAVAALAEAIRRPRVAWFAAAGACIGFSFLVKEAAVQWVPLPVVACLALPALRNRTGVRGAIAFLLAFAAVVAPWFAWVWAQTGGIFLVGHPGRAEAIGGSLMLPVALSVAVAAWRGMLAGPIRQATRVATPTAIAIGVVWGGAILYTLERNDAWNYPIAYWATVPRYLTSVAPNAQPYLLLVAALAWLAVRAVRGNDDARLLLAVASMFTPFAIFAANRSLQLRDALPIVYVAYLALGIATGDAARHVRRTMTPGQAFVPVALVALVAGAFVVYEVRSFTSANAEAASVDVRADSWDSSFVREIAASMDAHIPPGASVVTSRLYFSSLFIHTDGRYRIRQMPTVGVDIDGSSERLLVRRSNLFRWEDREVRPAQPGDTWLWLKRFEEKNYWVGLGQEELLEYLRIHDVTFIVLTGEDVAFSSLQATSYLSGHPAFTLIDSERRSDADEFYLYALDRSKLEPRDHSTAISPEDADSLVRESGRSSDQIERALGAPLRITDENDGLSVREQQAAKDGVDLGLR